MSTPDGGGSREKTIRDPIHGPIRVTALEQMIIDQAEFQRLHNVLQQSVAYLTYPSNRTSRFSHSVGAMELAGRLFKRMLENTPSPVLEEFIVDARQTIMNVFATEKQKFNDLQDSDEEKFQRLKADFVQKVGYPLGFNHRPLGRRSDLVTRSSHRSSSIDSSAPSPAGSFSFSDQDNFVLNVLWESVRVATLLHDIGHLPLSHLFEDAIIEFSKSRDSYDQQQIKGAGTSLAHLPAERASFVLRTRLRLRERYKAERLTRVGLETSGAAEERTQFHEALGFLINTSLKRWEGSDGPAYRMVVALAQQVIASDAPWQTGLTARMSPSARVLSLLHSVVSGEMDADRLDYCVRDPHAAGTTSAGIDVFTIINSASIALVSPRAVKDHLKSGFAYCNKSGDGEVTSGRFALEGFAATGALAKKVQDATVQSEGRVSEFRYIITHHARSLPAIESFFYSRYHSFYQVASDHNSARFFAIIKRIIVLIFTLVDKSDREKLEGPAQEVVNRLEQDGWFVRRDGELELPFLSTGEIVRFDDGWLRTALANVFRILDGEIKQSQEFRESISKLQHDRVLGSDHPEVDRIVSAEDFGYLRGSLQLNPILRQLWLLCEVYLNRRLDRVVSVFKTDTDVASIVERSASRLRKAFASEKAAVKFLESSGVKRGYWAKIVSRLTTKEVNYARFVEDTLTSTESVSGKELLEQLVHAELKNLSGKTQNSKLPQLGGVVPLVHSTKHKLPPQLAEDKFPSLWLHHHELDPRLRTLIPAQFMSRTLANFDQVASHRAVRLTLVGIALRSRTESSSKVVEHVRGSVVEAIARFAVTRFGETLEKKSLHDAKKSAAKKSAAKKSAAKKSAVKKSAVKKSAVKKSAVKKSAVKKSAVKKSAVKKSAVKKAATNRSATNKVAATKAIAKSGNAKRPKQMRGDEAIPPSSTEGSVIVRPHKEVIRIKRR